jgi:ATP-dependent Clp protease protease subunit
MTSPDVLPYIWVNEFEDEDVEKFYQHFYALEFFSDSNEITIFINSYGGQYHNCQAMRSLIKRASKPVATVVVGKAMSCGALLASSGSAGYRFATHESDFMVHEVSLSEIGGKNAEFQNSAKMLDNLNKKMIKQLGEDTKLSADEWKELIKGQGNVDLFMTPMQAKKYGLVDHIGMPEFCFLPSTTVLGFNRPMQKGPK